MRIPQRPHPIAVALAVIVALALVASVASTEPAPIEAKRAEVARIQAQVAEIDGEVGAAAERYNGARYRLDQVRQRIATNRRVLAENKKALKEARARLANRLDAIYRQPEPSIVDVIVSSESLTAAVDQVELLDRAGRADGKVVDNIRASRRRLEQARRELEQDRAKVEDEVAEAERERRQVEALLAERQRVLDSAEGELGRLIAEERERERREAEQRAAAARQAAAAARAQEAQQAQQTQRSTPTQPSAAAGAAAAAAAGTPAPASDGSGSNARAAQIALGYLGVPYVWGGASPSGFDCSGLASYSYAQVGKSVPHYTGAIWAAFPRVPSGQLQVGDMVFFRADLGHMGIYIGGGNYVHAPQTGDVVKVSPLGSRSDFVGAVRP
jgi:cell wall-associated NlpC family hydrolase